MAAPDEQQPPVLREDSLTYSPFPQSVTLARRRVARLVAQWGYPRLADDAALLTTELGANALFHACRLPRHGFQVDLTVRGGALRIAVTDTEPALPRPRVPQCHEQFGRGLILVEAIASRWGCAERADGKTVWCELDL